MKAGLPAPRFPLSLFRFYRTVALAKTSDVSVIGLISDGTICGEERICINHRCVPQPAYTESCPRGSGNTTCSGLGVSLLYKL